VSNRRISTVEVLTNGINDASDEFTSDLVKSEEE
jgi:hypothetical protein